MEKRNITHVFLDITSLPKDFLEKRFPTIYAECMQHGIDISKDWIPVMPVQHYFMGGINTDINARTNIPGLYACGESARTGVHGANRLASNSLLECLVFGRRCAQYINDSDTKSPDFSLNIISNEKNADIDFEAYSDEIRDIMTQKCGIIRNGEDLLQAQSRISERFKELESSKLNTPKGIETFNQAQVALEILKASILRTKSVGAHYRSDDKSLGDKKHA